ncbi:MAG: hypothetical protein HY908_02150 [Myxococcales bacterium]|nr:hypothetical protein [Myxococcales bacterium]
MGRAAVEGLERLGQPALFTVTLKLWAPAHFKRWEIFRQLLVLPEGGTASPSGGAVPATSNNLGPRFAQTATTGTTTTAMATTTRTEPVALDIEHPWCAMQGIHSVVPDKVGQPVGDGSGLYTIEITFRQYEKVKAAGGKPTGSVAQAAPGKYTGAGAGGGSGPVDASGGDPNEWATVPNPDGEDYRTHEWPTAAGEAVAGEAASLKEDP